MNNNIEIYTKSDCDYCVKLKSLLKEKNIPYVENKLNEDYTVKTLKMKFPNAKTYPVVVVDGFMIGGYTEFSNMVFLDEQLKSSSKAKLLNESI